VSEYLHCGVCKRIEWEVSEEDPDATFSDAAEHLQRRHPGIGLTPGIKDGRKP
jgi:hypothetical protein